ncbi:MAG: hypothetical protein KKD44_26735 [Proteobacteria bacterium]|nr:hypothetical protein [Pseudomonadota bacterium]
MTKEIKKRVIRALNRTWDIIGGDVLRLLEENDENPVLPRSHVAEIVTDADHDLMHGGDEEAIKEFHKLKYNGKAWNAIIKEAFPYKRYEW